MHYAMTQQMNGQRGCWRMLIIAHTYFAVHFEEKQTHTIEQAGCCV